MGILNKKKKRKFKKENFVEEILNDKVELIDETESIELKTQPDEDDLMIIEETNDSTTPITMDDEVLNFGGGDINQSPESEPKEDVVEYKKPQELNAKEYRFYLNTGKLPIKK
jgi:hypothetical protein